MWLLIVKLLHSFFIGTGGILIQKKLKNMKLEMLNKTNRFDHNHNYFLSLTNFFSKVKRKNFNYLYNFKNKNFLPEIDISNNFHIYQGHYLA